MGATGEPARPPCPRPPEEGPVWLKRQQNRAGLAAREHALSAAGDPTNTGSYVFHNVSLVGERVSPTLRVKRFDLS